jgi:hypothetical protein
MYKRKDRKILPVNTSLPHGINPGGNVNGGLNSDSNGPKLYEELPPIGKTVPRGSRLTSERLRKMKIGTGFQTERSWKGLFRR